MSKIKLNHSGGNAVSLNPPTDAPASADVALKLPATVGTAGQVLRNSSTPGTLEFGGLGGGITEVDQWRLNGDVSSTQDITSGIERNALTGSASPLGTGMSVSSGVFSFPSTGKWMVIAKAKFTIHDSDSVLLQTLVTINNSDYTAVTACNEGLNDSSGGDRDGGSASFYFLDVTDVSQVKVKFRADSISSGSSVRGLSDNAETSFIFIRLGDT